MTSARMIIYKIPAAFVVASAVPTAAEIATGFFQGWIDEQSAVEVALAKVERGTVLNEAEERLAFLLSDEFDQVQDILSDLAREVSDERENDRYWLCMALAWLRRNQAHCPDPLGVIELLYADFDYPPEIEGLVRYMPQPPGAEPGTSGIEHRWGVYVERALATYSLRESSVQRETES